MLGKNHLQNFTSQQFITKTVDSDEQRPSQLEQINQDIFYQANKIKWKMKNQSEKFRPKRTNTQLDHRYDLVRDTQTSHASRNSLTNEKQQNQLLGVYSNLNNFDLKNERTRHLSIGEVTQCQKNNESSLLAKMTIHCLRSNRRKLQERIELMQSRRRYTYNKIEKMKSQSKKSHNWSDKLKKVIYIDKQQKQKIKQISQEKQEELKSQREKVRQQVLQQRVHKQFIIDKTIRHKSDIGKKVRLEWEGLKKYKQYIHKKNFNKIVEKKQKQKEIKCQQKQIRNRKAQNRKLQARQKFQSKWKTQFERLAQIQNKAKQEQQIYTIEMQKANELFHSLEKQQI